MSQATTTTRSSRAAVSAAWRPPSGPQSGTRSVTRRAAGRHRSSAVAADDQDVVGQLARAPRADARESCGRRRRKRALVAAAEAASPDRRRESRRWPHRARPILPPAPDHARSRHRPRARRQPASGDCRHSADAPRLLRELAERRRAARGDDRPRRRSTRCSASCGRKATPTAPSRRAPASTPPSGRWSRCRRSSARSSRRRRAWLRTRLLLRLARRLVHDSYQGSRATRGLRRGTARIDVRASIFCTVREPVAHPLCGFYAAAFTRLLALFNLRPSATVVACRGTGEPTCVLEQSRCRADAASPESALSMS